MTTASETRSRTGGNDPGLPGGLLDWKGFQASYFPGHTSRHDLEVIGAYSRYRLDPSDVPGAVGGQPARES